jgi:hypothetical protein
LIFFPTYSPFHSNSVLFPAWFGHLLMKVNNKKRVKNTKQWIQSCIVQ